MLKKLFVLRLNNYWPELCKYTIPTIKHWAALNGWIYEEITEKVFQGELQLPITIEKSQVWWKGMDSDWNLMCDADVMLRPDLIDPTKDGDPRVVRSSYSFPASSRFKHNIYFGRDGRGIGISGGFVISSRFTHDLWNVPATDIPAGLFGTEQNPHLIDEWIISTNLARFGLPYDGVTVNPDTYIVHFGGTLGQTTAEEKAAAVVKARKLYIEWSQIWPSIENLQPDKNLLPFCQPESALK